MNSTSCLHLQTFRSHAAIVSENPLFSLFPIEKPKFPCRKIGQGQPRVTIYTNFVELESPMLHAKFQHHRTSGSGEEDFQKVFTIYGRGGHLDHVTWTIYTNLGYPFPMRIHIKLGFVPKSGARVCTRGGFP